MDFTNILGVVSLINSAAPGLIRLIMQIKNPDGTVTEIDLLKQADDLLDEADAGFDELGRPLAPKP